jgi:acyl carrier protein
MFRLDVLLPDDIADDAPLVGGSLDLDSCELLELALCIEETFGIAVRRNEESRIARGSISDLADFIRVRMLGARAPRAPAAGRAALRTAGALASSPLAPRVPA